MNTKLDDFINVLPTMGLYTDGAFMLYSELDLNMIKPLLYKLGGMWLERCDKSNLPCAKDTFDKLMNNPYDVVEKTSDLGKAVRDLVALTNSESLLHIVNHLNEEMNTDDYALISALGDYYNDYFIAYQGDSYFVIKNNVTIYLDAEERLEKTRNN